MDDSELQLRQLFAPSREEPDSADLAITPNAPDALFFPPHALQHSNYHSNQQHQLQFPTTSSLSAFRYFPNTPLPVFPSPATSIGHGAMQDTNFDLEKQHTINHLANTFAPSSTGQSAILDMTSFAYTPPLWDDNDLRSARGHPSHLSAESLATPRSGDAFSHHQRSHPFTDERATAAQPPLPRQEAAAPRIPLLAEKRRAMVLDASMRWISAKEASKAVNDFALFVQKKRARMDKKTSGGRNKKYICSCPTCGWFVRLIKVAKSDNWKISSMLLIHSPDCTGEAQPSARQLAELNALRTHAAAGASSGAFTGQNDFAAEGETLGVKIPVRLAYRAKKIIQENSSNLSSSIGALVNGVLGLPGRDLREKIAESYKLLPSLLQKFSELNPGSAVGLRKDEKGRFKSAFVLPAPLADFTASLQRVYGLEIVPCGTSSGMSMDDTASGARYSGHFVTILGKSGNFEHRVIAFGLVPTPDMENMSWFLRSLTNAGFQSGSAPVFLACHQLGALAATRRELPHATPMICTDSFIVAIDEHLAVPMQSFKFIEHQIRLASLAETEEAFRSHVGTIAQHYPAVANYLLSFDSTMWAAYASRAVKKYRWVSSGFSDYMRSDVQIAIKSTRLPVGKTDNAEMRGGETSGLDVQHIEGIKLVDFETMVPLEIIYQFLLRHLHIETTLAAAAETRNREETTTAAVAGSGTQQHVHLTPAAERFFRQELFESDYVDVRISAENASVALASSKFGVYKVHMAESQCPCPTMQQLGIPCRHLLAVARTFGSSRSIRTECDQIYTAAIYQRGLQSRSALEDRIPALSGLNRDSSIYPAPTCGSDGEDRTDDFGWPGSSDARLAERGGFTSQEGGAAGSSDAMDRDCLPDLLSPFSRSVSGENSGSDGGRGAAEAGRQWIV